MIMRTRGCGCFVVLQVLGVCSRTQWQVCAVSAWHLCMTVVNRQHAHGAAILVAKLNTTPACTHYESQLYSTRDCSALSVLHVVRPCSKQTHCRLWSCCNPHVLPAFFTAGRFLRQFDFPAFPDFPSFPSFPSIPTVTTTTPGGGTVTTGTYTSGPGASASSSSSTGGSGGSVMQTSTSQGGSKPVTTTTGRCACSIVSDTSPSVVFSVNDNAF